MTSLFMAKTEEKNTVNNNSNNIFLTNCNNLQLSNNITNAKKYTLKIDLKNMNKIEYKASVGLNKYVYMDPYIQRVIIRNNLLILFEKMSILKTILSSILKLKPINLNNYNYIKDSIEQIIPLSYQIINYLFKKDSIDTLNNVIPKKSPLRNNEIHQLNFTSIKKCLGYISSLYSSITDYFKNCMITFFILCSKIRKKMYKENNVKYIVFLVKFLKNKIINIVQFYTNKLKNNKTVTESLPQITKNYNWKSNITLQNNILYSKINLEKDTTRGVTNFSQYFNSNLKANNSNIQLFKSKHRHKKKISLKKIENMNNKLEDLLEILNKRKEAAHYHDKEDQFIPSNYKRLLN